MQSSSLLVRIIVNLFNLNLFRVMASETTDVISGQKSKYSRPFSEITEFVNRAYLPK